MEQNQFSLSPGQETRFIIRSPEMPGNYDINVKSKIIGKPDSFSREIKDKITVLSKEECYKQQLMTREIIVPRAEKTSVLEIKNLGLEYEEYNIELNAPDWASIDKNDISLEKNENGIVEIITNPGQDIKEDSRYDATLILVSGEYKYPEKFVIIVSDKTLFEQILENKCNLTLLFFGLSPSWR